MMHWLSVAVVVSTLTTVILCEGDFDCAFEGTLCGWTQPPMAFDVEWVVQQGATPNANTGPEVDRTTGTISGAYVYYDGRSYTADGTATLKSPELDSRFSNGKLSFWLNMYGSGIDSLRIYQRPADVFSHPNLELLIITGQQSTEPMWLHREVNLTEVSYNFHIAFKTTEGTSIESDVAIDDVELISPEISTTDSSIVTTKEATTTRQIDVQSTTGSTTELVGSTESQPIDQTSAIDSTGVDFNCAFEGTLCGWTQPAMAFEVDWVVQQGATPNANTGPEVDRTTGTISGAYVYYDGRSYTADGTATLKSPELDFRFSNGKLSFWLNMYGSGIDSLRIYQRPADVFSHPNLELLIITGQQSTEPMWLHREVNLTEVSYNFHIAFKTTEGTSIESDVAIDDVELISPEISTTDSSIVTTKEATSTRQIDVQSTTGSTTELVGSTESQPIDQTSAIDSTGDKHYKPS
ncbi:MAM and LDL-receptor class A domain-containing protein 1-like [Patiria miniata]|uniref:MAM domain-containing protein n=1 Tax=Patiria miniata TaxID=46514 RepID=A0A913ZN12_PATMI|nr:MAM and LDL-receptor class A domain-containing protein 1-like [Patiria miniata]